MSTSTVIMRCLEGGGGAGMTKRTATGFKYRRVRRGEVGGLCIQGGKGGENYGQTRVFSILFKMSINFLPHFPFTACALNSHYILCNELHWCGRSLQWYAFQRRCFNTPCNNNKNIVQIQMLG